MRQKNSLVARHDYYYLSQRWKVNASHAQQIIGFNSFAAVVNLEIALTFDNLLLVLQLYRTNVLSLWFWQVIEQKIYAIMFCHMLYFFEFLGPAGYMRPHVYSYTAHDANRS
jgi:hypothetical protein